MINLSKIKQMLIGSTIQDTMVSVLLERKQKTMEFLQIKMEKYSREKSILENCAVLC